ncbi:MAG: hypothetical protein LBN27_11440 [Prevotellaceae bacterium]|jgi:hypothetical protein|nr:hypothetical protein [Prevotellaceae bacterium]GHT33832.1 hypothetical protein FACS189434_08950 [Bacteroidia bacterium]
MARVAGITVEKTYTGKPKSITFSYPKYGSLLRDMFKERMLEFPVTDIPNERTKDAIREAGNYNRLQSFNSVDDLLSDCFK